MLLVVEIGIEILMIAAVIGSVAVFTYLLRVTVREHAELRHRERERMAARAARRRASWAGEPGMIRRAAAAQRDTSPALRERRA